MNTFLADLSVDALVQIISLFLAVISFLIVQTIERRRDRAVANREAYQNLEFASIDLFRFEADHLDLIRPIWEPETEFPDEDTAEYTALMNYVCQTLNLFEMAIKFRKYNVLADDIFGSWVTWFELVVGAPGFPTIWEDVRLDYLPELRNIFDGGLRILDEPGTEEAKEQKFYEYVGYVLGSKLVSEWTADDEHDRYINFQKKNLKKLQKYKKSMSDIDIKTGWGDSSLDVQTLVNMFQDNAGNSYISHGEIMEGRAINPVEWASDLASHLEHEFTETLKNEPFQKANMVCAWHNETLIGFALVEYDSAPDDNYAILSDIVVSLEFRNQNVAAKMTDWLKTQLYSQNIKKMFAESNINNETAHHFLEKTGFKTISKVFYMEL